MKFPSLSKKSSQFEYKFTSPTDNYNYENYTNCHIIYFMTFEIEMNE